MINIVSISLTLVTISVLYFTISASREFGIQQYSQNCETCHETRSSGYRAEEIRTKEKHIARAFTCFETISDLGAFSKTRALRRRSLNLGAIVVHDDEKEVAHLAEAAIPCIMDRAMGKRDRSRREWKEPYGVCARRT